MKSKLFDFLEHNSATISRLPKLLWYGGYYRYLIDTNGANAKRKKTMSQVIQKKQRPDGGFRIQTKGSAGSVVETAVALDFLMDIKSAVDSKVLRSGIDYLLSQQHENGGFSENPLVSHPVEWDDKHIFEKRVPTPHVTAWVTSALLQARQKQSRSAISNALNYLARTQKPEGGWSHFQSDHRSSPYLTGLIFIALGEFSEFEHAVDYPLLRQYFLDRQKRNGSIGDCLDASLLVAEAWANTGADANEPNMNRLLQWILDQQNADGSFIDLDCGWPDSRIGRITCSMNVARVLCKANL